MSTRNGAHGLALLRIIRLNSAALWPIFSPPLTRVVRHYKKEGHRPQRFTEERVAQAVEEANGILPITARNLGCSKSTVYEYLKRYPSLKDVLSEARESVIDFAESAPIKAIEADNLTAIIFFLKTQGKSQGL